MTDFCPRDIREAAQLIAEGGAQKESFEIIGHGSKRTLGRPVSAHHVLSACNITGVRLYEPNELVVIAGAGTPLTDIEDVLAANGQQFAFEPPDWRSLWGETSPQTLGGIVATNLSGPRRFHAGAARDHVLGFTGINGRGEIIKSGGRVVKNVTGYDLSKLVTGSYGTLVFLTDLTLKVLPKPERSATLLILNQTADDAVRLMARALGSPLEISGAAWLPGDMAENLGMAVDSVAALRLEGSVDGVSERLLALRAQLQGHASLELDDDMGSLLWRSLRDAAPMSPYSDKAIWRISVSPMQGPELLAAFPDAPGYLDWGGGLVWLALPQEGDGGATLLRSRLAKYGGHATLIRGAADLRSRIAVFEPQLPALAALTARVKTSFDPLGILNPGRIYADM